MKTYEIMQEGAGVFEIEAETEDQAIREMAEGVVDTTENWQLQFNTDEREAAIERAAKSLSVVGRKINLTEKRTIGKHLRGVYSHINGRDVRFGSDGAVSIMVDEMPNTNQAGRIFAGWDIDLLKEI